MIEYDIAKAFFDSIALEGYCDEIQEPNTTLTNPPDDLWIALHLLPSSTTPVTLGEQGEDNHIGILQVDINYPLNSGMGVLLETADNIARDYVAGRVITYNGTQVKIQGSSLSPGRVAGGYFKVSLSIRYNARSKRNA